jgi:hypothetical protein
MANKMFYPNNEIPLAMQINELLILWINLKTIILHGKNQTQKTIDHMAPFPCNTKKGQIQNNKEESSPGLTVGGLTDNRYKRTCGGMDMFEK